jgi:DNA (cytosine-5)-methyltransferase 1
MGSPATPKRNSRGGDAAAVRLGSDCSGYGSEFLALKQCGVDVRTVFCAEIDANKVKLLKRTHDIHNDSDYTLYSDIKTRDCIAAPVCDLFVSGAPCQASSSAGKGAGLDDLLDRGVTLFHSLDYVRHKRPRVAVFENVRGLTFKKHADVLNSVEKILQGLNNRVHKKVLNTREHGIPHNRPRLYIVAILQSGMRRKYVWPEPVIEPDLHRFLDVLNNGRKRDINNLSKLATDNIVRFRKKLLQERIDIFKHWYVIDIQAGKQYRHMARNRSPCITKSRGSSCGFFVSRLKRRMQVVEMARLQGLTSTMAREFLDAVGGDEKIVGQGAGDSMSLNVLMRVLPRARYAARLIDKSPFDVWARRPPAAGILPDVLYERGADVGDPTAA